MRASSILRNAVVCLALGGCSSQFALTPPSSPTGTEFAAHYKINFEQIPDLSTPDETLTGRRTLYWGGLAKSYVDFADTNCTIFFDAVEELNRKGRVGQSVFQTASTQAVVVLEAAKAAGALAFMAAGTEIAKVFIEQSLREFAFQPHATQLRALVREVMGKQKIEIYEMVNNGIFKTKIDAIVVGRAYARSCTLSAIRDHWDRAIAKAVREGVKRVGDNPAGQPPAEAGGGLNFPRPARRTVGSAPGVTGLLSDYAIID